MAHDFREVLTPLGRRIKCRDGAEFLRVTRWVAWLRRRQAERNEEEAAAIGKMTPRAGNARLAMKRAPDDGTA